MRAYPGAFVERSLLIATLTSETVNYLIGIASNLFIPSGCGVSCLSLLARSWVCGWNTFSKWSGRVFTFRISLLVHSPPDVLSGGIGICGRSSRLMASHSE